MLMMMTVIEQPLIIVPSSFSCQVEQILWTQQMPNQSFVQHEQLGQVLIQILLYRQSSDCSTLLYWYDDWLVVRTMIVVVISVVLALLDYSTMFDSSSSYWLFLLLLQMLLLVGHQLDCTDGYVQAALLLIDPST